MRCRSSTRAVRRSRSGCASDRGLSVCLVAVAHGSISTANSQLPWPTRFLASSIRRPVSTIEPTACCHASMMCWAACSGVHSPGSRISPRSTSCISVTAGTLPCPGDSGTLAVPGVLRSRLHRRPLPRCHAHVRRPLGTGPLAHNHPGSTSAGNGDEQCTTSAGPSAWRWGGACSHNRRRTYYGPRTGIVRTQIRGP